MRIPKNIPAEELRTVAGDVLEHAGVTQKEAAETLGVAPPTISQALAGGHRPLTDVLIRLIETYSGYELEGPIYRSRRKK